MFDNMFPSDPEQKSNAINRVLSKVIYALLFVLVLSISFNFYALKTIDVSIPPDLSKGAIVKAGQKDLSEVYSFTYSLFQQLQRWEENGSTDYESNLNKYKHYITPNYRQILKKDIERRIKDKALEGRTRNVGMLPGEIFDFNKVRKIGNGVWEISLTLRLIEEYEESVIKDLIIEYPLRVIFYDVDKQKNPWRLAIDGYTKKPTVLKEY